MRNNFNLGAVRDTYYILKVVKVLICTLYCVNFAHSLRMLVTYADPILLLYNNTKLIMLECVLPFSYEGGIHHGICNMQ